MTSVRFKHLIIASVVGLGSLLLVSAASPGSFFEVTKQLDIFTTLYRELNTYYVDTLNASQLIQSGMRVYD
jgi:carboxyl-terminal processing protease